MNPTVKRMLHQTALGGKAFLFAAETSNVSYGLGFYRLRGDTQSKLGSVPTGTPKDSLCCSVTSDGTRVAVGLDTTPFFEWFSTNVTATYPVIPDTPTLTKLTNPVTMPTDNVVGLAWDPTTTYLAVATAASPYVIIYKYTAPSGVPTLTKLANPGSLPAGEGKAVSWMNSGGTIYLIVANGGGGAAQHLTIYEKGFGTDVFTKISSGSNPSYQGASGDAPWAVAVDPLSRHFAYGSNYSPYLVLYSMNNAVFTKITNPSTLPTAPVTALAWDAQGTYLALVTAGSPGLMIYKRNGATFTLLTTVDAWPYPYAGQVGAVCFDLVYDSLTGIYSSNHLYISNGNYNVGVYKRNGDTFTRLTGVFASPNDPTGQIFGLSLITPTVGKIGFSQ